MENANSTSSEETFDIKLTHKGKTITLSHMTTQTTIGQLRSQTRQSFDLSEDAVIKLLYKGKKFDQEESPAFPNIPTKTPKLVVMSTQTTQIHQLNSKKSDPLMRGFDNETTKPSSSSQKCSCCWGPNHTTQNRHYKFVRFSTVHHHAFGTQPTSSTPHAFRANALLEKLSTDPGIVKILTERELVVNTLGEMDPIDDRIMQKKQAQGLCLLGYNTNRGLRIDLKLRTDNLEGFRDYKELVCTLIHELSHNWVGEHDALFFANYGTMRIEYLTEHLILAKQGYKGVNGRSCADVAGVKEECSGGMERVLEVVKKELMGETGRYGVDFRAVLPVLESRWRELQVEVEERMKEGGATLGGAAGTKMDESVEGRRQRALAAAERRLKTMKENDGASYGGSGNNSGGSHSMDGKR